MGLGNKKRGPRPPRYTLLVMLGLVIIAPFYLWMIAAGIALAWGV